MAPSGSPINGSPLSRGVVLTCVLWVFLAIDIGLLCFALSDPFDGFHGFQEAWYAAIAENYSSHSLLEPTKYDGALDLNVPPFFSYLVYASFSLFGQTEFAARLVPVVFALLTLLATWVLAGMLIRRGAGLEAAALLASTPIFLIMGRSVQTDIVFVALSMFSVFFYLRATRSDRRRDFVLAGLLMGFAFFTKQFAVVPLASLILWELGGAERRRLLTANFLLFLLMTGVVLVPYYGYHVLADPARLLDSQLHGSAGLAGLATGAALTFLLTEMVWGCSPLALVGGLAGLTIFTMEALRGGPNPGEPQPGDPNPSLGGPFRREPSEGDSESVSPLPGSPKSQRRGLYPITGRTSRGPRLGDCPRSVATSTMTHNHSPFRRWSLLAVLLACYFVFYLFLHKHTYYYLGLVPFLALCFTAIPERMPTRVYAGLLVTTLLTSTTLSAYQLAGCKYGFGEFKEIGERLRDYERPVVVAEPSFYLNYEPLFYYYADNATLHLRGDEFDASEKQRLRETKMVFSFSEIPLGNAGAVPIKGVRYGLRLGDSVYIHTPPNPHFFSPSLPTEATAYEILASFGSFVKLEQTSFFLTMEPLS